MALISHMNKMIENISAGTVMFWGVGQVEEGGERGRGGENMRNGYVLGSRTGGGGGREGEGGENMPEQLCFGEWDRWRRGERGGGG